MKKYLIIAAVAVIIGALFAFYVNLYYNSIAFMYFLYT